MHKQKACVPGPRRLAWQPPPFHDKFACSLPLAPIQQHASGPLGPSSGQPGPPCSTRLQCLSVRLADDLAPHFLSQERRPSPEGSDSCF
jgi:hypothetical protein